MMDIMRTPLNSPEANAYAMIGIRARAERGVEEVQRSRIRCATEEQAQEQARRLESIENVAVTSLVSVDGEWKVLFTIYPPE